MKNIKTFGIILSILFTQFSAWSQIRVGDVFIERKEIFEKSDKDWFFAAPLLNSLHTNTFEYVIKDELLFNKGDIIEDDYLYETERNLRYKGLFNSVRIELDSIRDDTYNIYIITKDRWSTYPSLLFGSGGGQTNYGGRFEEFNLFGTGTYVSLEALHRNENNTGWQGFAQIKQSRLFRSDFALDASVLANKYRTEQIIDFSKPFRTLETNHAFGLVAQNKFGADFLFRNSDTTRLMDFHNRKVNLFFSKAWSRKDRVFMTIWAEWQDVERGDKLYRQAFDNSGKVFLAFSSVAQDFYSIEKVNTYDPEDLVIGGWGSAILGKVFPIAHKGEGFYYVAGQGERSYYKDNLYLFGSVAASSGFIRSNAMYTYQDFTGIGFYKLTNNLTFAARLKQQTVWNWFALRQLILDNESGLRGYDVNKMSGDNRIIGNWELRFFPDFRLLVFNISAVAFHDIGAVWSQDLKLSKAQFKNSSGLGLRFHFTKSANPKHIFRIDFAYNHEQGKFGGIIFTTEQMFSAFSNHEFRLPKIFGTDFDYE